MGVAMGTGASTFHPLAIIASSEFLEANPNMPLYLTDVFQPSAAAEANPPSRLRRAPWDGTDPLPHFPKDAPRPSCCFVEPTLARQGDANCGVPGSGSWAAVSVAYRNIWRDTVGLLRRPIYNGASHPSLLR